MISKEHNVKDRITAYVNNYFIKESGLVVKDDTSFLDEGIIDSTGVLELIAYIETTFEIRIEDEEIIPNNFDSINKLVDFVCMKLN